MTEFERMCMEALYCIEHNIGKMKEFIDKGSYSTKDLDRLDHMRHTRDNLLDCKKEKSL